MGRTVSDDFGGVRRGAHGGHRVRIVSFWRIAPRSSSTNSPFRELWYAKSAAATRSGAISRSQRNSRGTVVFRRASARRTWRLAWRRSVIRLPSRHAVVDEADEIARDESAGEGVRETDQAADERDLVTDEELSQEREVRTDDSSPLQHEDVRREEERETRHQAPGDPLDDRLEPEDPDREHGLDFVGRGFHERSS